MLINKTFYNVANWYRQPTGTSENFQLFRDKLEQIRMIRIKIKTLIASRSRRFQL